MIEDDEIRIERFVLCAFNQETKSIGVKMMGSDESRNLSLEIDRNQIPIQLMVEPLDQLSIELPPILACDLLKDILDALGNDLLKVMIYDLSGDEYLTSMHILVKDQIGSVDISLYDALTLVSRAHCPLYVKEKVFDLCDQKKHSRIHWYDMHEEYALDVLNKMPAAEMMSYPKDELNIFLTKTIEQEDYILAKKLKEVLETKD
jgi:bifunctional DNase/RNase